MVFREANFTIKKMSYFAMQNSRSLTLSHIVRSVSRNKQHSENQILFSFPFFLLQIIEIEIDPIIKYLRYWFDSTLIFNFILYKFF